MGKKSRKRPAGTGQGIKGKAKKHKDDNFKGKGREAQSIAGSSGPGGFSLERMAALVAPLSCQEFFSTVWEEQPMVFRNKFTKEFFPGKFTFESLLEIAETSSSQGKKKPLEFGIDINAAQYKDGVRETPNRETVADKCTLKELFKDGITFQFHQPQRFNDDLMTLMGDLEAELGCLVGCNAYITPKGSQGLAPHHDDVEIFVCQTHGKKRWRLYQPLAGFQLPSQSSGDLPESIIGSPIMDVVLQEGDVLYMPRGIIHQAAAQKEDSTHLTVSTYQRWSWGDLASNVLQQALTASGEPGCLPLSSRRSLPPGFLYQHGLAPVSSCSGTVAQGHAATLASCLREMANQIEAHPAMLAIAADCMALDVQRSRLAPHQDTLPPSGKEPSPGCKIAPRCAKGTFRIVPAEDSSEGLMLLHCLDNDRMLHMMPDMEDEVDNLTSIVVPAVSDDEGNDSLGSEDDSEDGDSESADPNLIGPFPDSWLDAVVQVLGATEAFPVDQLEIEDEEQLEVAHFLWSCGALATTC